MASYIDTRYTRQVEAYKCIGDNKDFIKNKLMECHSFSEENADKAVGKLCENDHIIPYGDGVYSILADTLFNQQYEIDISDKTKLSKDEIISHIIKKIQSGVPEYELLKKYTYNEYKAAMEKMAR